MANGGLMPSESEWKVMEVFWENGEPLTSQEVINRLEGSAMSVRMVRVLINRLCQKGVLGFRVDKSDSRIYHYFAVRTKEECLDEKSRRFVDSYFSGNRANAAAALLRSATLTDEQIDELKGVLERSRSGKEGKKE